MVGRDWWGDVPFPSGVAVGKPSLHLDPSQIMMSCRLAPWWPLRACGSPRNACFSSASSWLTRSCSLPQKQLMVAQGVTLCPGCRHGLRSLIPHPTQILPQSSRRHRVINTFSAKLNPSFPTRVGGCAGISSHTAWVTAPDPGAVDTPLCRVSAPAPHHREPPSPPPPPSVCRRGAVCPRDSGGEAPKFSLSLYLIGEPLDLAAPSCPVTCGGQECLSRSLAGMLNKQGLMSVPAVPHQTPPQTPSLPACCYLLFSFPGSCQSA